MRHLAPLCLLCALCGCAVGPDYRRPQTESAKTFKEIQGWKLAEPGEELPRGSWWNIYRDPVLDQLMAQIDVSNQTVKQAEAQYRAARAAVLSARFAYFPTISAAGSATRSSGASSRFISVSTPRTSSINNTYNLSLDASWELDLWGRLRRISESAQASAGASAADLAAARLSAQAELAQDYFQLRVTDAERKYLDDEVGGFERSLKITQNQYAAGVAKRSDLLQAQTQLKSTQAQALDLQITRAQLEHAIAVLLGKNPSNFSLEPAPLTTAIPAIPAGLPSELLERRPDIAAAERRVIAANAQIGVARAAYFPSLSLAGTIGYQSTAFEHLVSAANRVWSVGPSLALPLLDAGSHIAASRQALAGYDSAVAAYRETTLAAFRDVEDNLVALRILAEEQAVQDDAAKAAQDAANIALNQYKAGTTGFLEVVVVQSTALANARDSLSIRGRKLVASVALIKALGGGWSAPDQLR
jgi:NodT family efflux transporter outer membrane factor (OMF) lipoprotein